MNFDFSKFRELILFYRETLHEYDLFAMVWIFVFFFLLLIFSILIRHRKTTSLFAVLIAFITITILPIYSYFFIHDHLYGTKTEITYLKQLEFTDSIIIEGDLQNIGEEKIEQCKIFAKVLPKLPSYLDSFDFIFNLKSSKSAQIDLEDLNLEKYQSMHFKIKIENFKTSRELNISDISVYPNCYSKRNLDF